MTIMQALESQIRKWKKSYLHNIIQFCVRLGSMFFEVQLIFYYSSSERLGRHTENLVSDINLQTADFSSEYHIPTSIPVS